MIDVFVRIKRLILAQRVIFTAKAESEMYSDKAQFLRLAALPCPMCGRRTLVDVVEDCKLSGGRMVNRLRQTRCKSCGERFFHVAAMVTIEAGRRSAARRRPA